MAKHNGTNSLSSFFLFLYGCTEAFAHAKMITLKTRNGITALTTFVTIMFLPILVLLICLALSAIISPIIPEFFTKNTCDITNIDILSIIVLLILLYLPLQFLVLLIISIIELVFYFIHAEDKFKKYFKLQMCSNNYSLIIISLLAFCPALVAHTPEKINISFLIYGILFFTCIIITDIYKECYLSENIIKNIYQNVTDVKTKE